MCVCVCVCVIFISSFISQVTLYKRHRSYYVERGSVFFLDCVKYNYYQQQQFLQQKYKKKEEKKSYKNKKKSV